MQARQLINPSHLRTHRRVGRGGKRGTFSGRDVKGQKSRAGHRIRPAIWDYIGRIPKLRGFSRKSNVSEYGHSYKALTPTFTINVSDVAKIAKAVKEVTAITLVQAGVVSRYKGKLPRVKILGDGEIATAVTVSGVH